MTDRLEEAVNRGETPVELLNGLTSDGAGWVLRRANKSHMDHFGDLATAIATTRGIC